MTTPDAHIAPGWDCHVHVFDPLHPVRPGHYQPTLRDLSEIESLAAPLGVGHLVLVQPSVYGTDNRLILKGLSREPGRHRAVVVVDASISDAELDTMHDLGVRGIRFNLVSPVGNSLSDFAALAPRLKSRGWHVQWYAKGLQLDAIAELHAGSGLTPVLDHLAGIHAGIDGLDPVWSSLQRLVDMGAWIKLSGWYRLQASAPYDVLHESILRVAETAGNRVVWGSDWPHTAFAHDSLPSYESVWHPVAQALGKSRAAAASRAGSILYA